MKKLILVIPVIIVLIGIVAIIFLLLGKWGWCLLFLSFAFWLNWRFEVFAWQLSSKSVDEGNFKILSFNINRAYDFSINEGSSIELIDVILGQRADIILLQEYNANIYPEIDVRLIDAYPYSASLDETCRFKSVYSRFPIIEIEQLTIDENDKRYGAFQSELYSKHSLGNKEILPISKMAVGINNHIIHIINCHLMSNNYSVEIRNIRQKMIGIYKGFLSILKRMDFGYRCRETQMGIVKGNIEEDIPTIVCGDFNDIGGSSVVRILKKMGFNDAWWISGLGYGCTFHGMWLRFRLDHICYSGNSLKALSAKVVKTKVSDHYPLVTDFIFLDN